VPGFATAIDRYEHFFDHGSDVGATDEVAYEALAVAFLSIAKPSHVLQCRRRKGDTVRFNPVSNEFGVIAVDGTVRTYYKPIRCVDLPPSLVGIKRCHNFSSHMDYYEDSCTK